MKAYHLLTILTIVILASCKKHPLNPTGIRWLAHVFRTGLNVGRIIINNNPWLNTRPSLFSTTRPLQLYSYPNGDSIVILLNGGYKDISMQYQQPRTLFIVIKNISIATDNDLLQLNGRRYDLDGRVNYGGFSDPYGYNKTGNGAGNLTFGKSKRNK